MKSTACHGALPFQSLPVRNATCPRLGRRVSSTRHGLARNNHGATCRVCRQDRNDALSPVVLAPAQRSTPWLRLRPVSATSVACRRRVCRWSVPVVVTVRHGRSSDLVVVILPLSSSPDRSSAPHLPSERFPAVIRPSGLAKAVRPARGP